jgi:hypothetical protein
MVSQSVPALPWLASRRRIMAGSLPRVTLGDGVIQLRNDPGRIDSIGIPEVGTSGGSDTHEGSQPSFGVDEDFPSIIPREDISLS